MRTTTIQIRLEPPEKAAFEAAARVAGTAMSAWVRERLRWAARQELEDAGQDVPFLTPHMAASR